MKFKLHDIRESKVWQEAHELGREKGKDESKREMIETLMAKGMSPAQIAELLNLPPEGVMQLTKARP
jgi:predicted transposase YdaD